LFVILLYLLERVFRGREARAVAVDTKPAPTPKRSARLGPLLPEIPSMLGGTDREDAFLGARLLLVSARATERGQVGWPDGSRVASSRTMSSWGAASEGSVTGSIETIRASRRGADGAGIAISYDDTGISVNTVP
jgi:hypothetical protein